MRGLGLRRRDTSSLDRPWEGLAVVRKLVSIEGGDGIVGQGLVGGPIRQLTLSLGKIVSLAC